MYAVVAQSGKQSIFRPGELADIDHVKAEVGDTITFDQVLCYHDGESAKFGKPLVEGVAVTAKVVAQHRDKKVQIIHFKRRKHHLKRHGHRQDYTRVEIVDIVDKAAAPKKASKAKAAAPKKPAKTEAAATKKPAKTEAAAPKKPSKAKATTTKKSSKAE